MFSQKYFHLCSIWASLLTQPLLLATRVAFFWLRFSPKKKREFLLESSKMVHMALYIPMVKTEDWIDDMEKLKRYGL